MSNRKAIPFFGLCQSCGSAEWIELHEVVNYPNGLNELGETIINNSILNTEECICSNCEEKLRMIPFKDVPKFLRKKIYFMPNNERMSWVHGYLVAKQLIKEEIKDGGYEDGI